jgi:hypothetical protein
MWRSSDVANWGALGEFSVPGATGLSTRFPMAIFDDLLVFGTNGHDGRSPPRRMRNCRADGGAVVTVFDLQTPGSATTITMPEGCLDFGFEVDIAFGDVLAPCTVAGSARDLYLFRAHNYGTGILISSSDAFDFADHIGFTGSHLTLTSASEGKSFCHSMYVAGNPLARLALTLAATQEASLRGIPLLRRTSSLPMLPTASDSTCPRPGGRSLPQ